jgi:hypothetical protein
MTPLATLPLPLNVLPPITWEKLPDDFVLPDEPVEGNLQPLLASALRESLELAGFIDQLRLIAWYWFSIMTQITPNAYDTKITVFLETTRRDPCYQGISSVFPIRVNQCGSNLKLINAML